MGFHGVFADEKFGGDLAIAQALGDQLQDFQLAGRDPQAFALFFVGDKRFAGGGRHGNVHRNFLNHDSVLRFGQLQAQPDAQDGEDRGGKPAVNFDGMVDDQEAVLGEFQHGDQNSADQTVDEDVALHSRVGIERLSRGESSG